MGSTVTVDLNTIGDGLFPCPQCRALLSPDDESDKIYEIAETKVEEGQLKELLLKCKCGCMIRLVGFIGTG